jgi:hypothetical protein
MCLAADEILLGDYAVLSPIDITLYLTRDDDEEHETFPDEEPGESEVELVAIDHFIQVAKQARIDIEMAFRQRGWKSSRTDVESNLLCEMTRQLGVLQIAKFYREKNVTQVYAEELLMRCMFSPGTITRSRLDGIVRRLIVEAPAHEFPMDYHICRDVGLNVREMDEDLSDATRDLIRTMDRLAHQRLICLPIHPGAPRLPHFQFFAYNVAASKELGEPVTVSVEGERTNGKRDEQAEQQ